MKKVALVTGASSGIGWELAQELARNSYDLVISARSKNKLEELKTVCEKQFSAKVWVIDCDLAKQAGPSELVERFNNLNLPLDLLVNNAGFGDYGVFHERPLSKALEMIQVNITSLTELTHRLLPEIVKSKGMLVNIASTAAFQPGPLMSVYYASKSYVLSFTEGISEELKSSGARALAICPGPTTSGFQNAANLEGSNLLKGRKLPTSKDLAEYCYRKINQNQVVVVHGIANKMGSLLPRFLSRAFVRKFVMNLQKQR